MPKKITTLVYSCERCPHGAVSRYHGKIPTIGYIWKCQLLNKYVREHVRSDDRDNWISPECPLEDS